MFASAKTWLSLCTACTRTGDSMTDSVHEFEELWAVEGDHAAEVSSDVDREDASPDALGVDKALEVHPEASDNSEATSKSTDDPQQETPSTRQHGRRGRCVVKRRARNNTHSLAHQQGYMGAFQ